MTELETAFTTIVNVFNMYASKEGTLTNEGMKTLMEKELPGIRLNAKGKDASDKILKDLKENRGAILSLDEFLILVAKVLVIRRNETK
ncbi:protein S100-P-like [Bombina bombina]|uniref:protein S100-P-like n=1 Tax=Bombina bombina TaxID=8345 RepID=UPI00235AFEBC|nr:protein S100-P-like [Bombina bombina]